jgi:hypothetical protein
MLSQKAGRKLIIIPVPKKPCPKDNYDFRPVAPTSIIMKVFERIMAGILKHEVKHLLDPYQCAHQTSRSTDDALNTATHLVLKHTENPKAYARLLFMGFSSAFNTILPQTLLKKPFVIKWCFAFLTGRQKQGKIPAPIL